MKYIVAICIMFITGCSGCSSVEPAESDMAKECHAFRQEFAQVKKPTTNMIQKINECKAQGVWD